MLDVTSKLLFFHFSSFCRTQRVLSQLLGRVGAFNTSVLSLNPPTGCRAPQGATIACGGCQRKETLSLTRPAGCRASPNAEALMPAVVDTVGNLDWLGVALLPQPRRLVACNVLALRLYDDDRVASQTRMLTGLSPPLCELKGGPNACSLHQVKCHPILSWGWCR